MHYIILICSLVFIMRDMIRLQEKKIILLQKFIIINILPTNFHRNYFRFYYTPQLYNYKCFFFVKSINNNEYQQKNLCCRFNPFNKSAMSSFNFFIDVIFYFSQFQTFVIDVNYHRIFLKYKKVFVKTRDFTTLLSRNIQNVLSLTNNHYHPLEKLAAENYILLFDFTQITIIVKAEWHISLEHFFSVLPF